MILRRHPLGQYSGALGPDQAIKLYDALGIFTRIGARALRLDSVTGQLTQVCSADMLVLQTPIETLTLEEIGALQPSAMIFEGSVVYGEI